MSKRIGILFIILCTSVLPCLLGCGGAKPAKPPVDEPKRITVGVSLWNLDDAWNAQMKADIEAAAAKHPKFQFVFKDAQNNAEQQKKDVERLLADSVKLLIIHPKDAQLLADPLAKAFDAGIPIVVLNRPLIGDKYSCYLAPDNKGIGKAVGIWLAAKLGGKGKIVEIKGPVDAVCQQDRHAAFRAELRDPSYRFVFEGPVDPPKVDASQLMKTALDTVEQIDAVFAYSDEAAKAAHEVAQSVGREKNTLFIGVDALPNLGQKFLEEGAIDVSCSCPTGGTEAVETAIKLLEGQSAPKSIILEPRLFTKENVRQGGEPVAKP